MAKFKDGDKVQIEEGGGAYHDGQVAKVLASETLSGGRVCVVRQESGEVLPMPEDDVPQGSTVVDAFELPSGTRYVVELPGGLNAGFFEEDLTKEGA